MIDNYNHHWRGMERKWELGKESSPHNKASIALTGFNKKSRELLILFCFEAHIAQRAERGEKRGKNLNYCSVHYIYTGRE